MPRGDVQIVYITVDPDRDNAARMKQVSRRRSIRLSSVAPVRAEQLAAVRKEYGISADKKKYGSNYTYAHSSYTYLIDREGNLRALMPYGHRPDDYVHDLRILLSE